MAHCGGFAGLGRGIVCFWQLHSRLRNRLSRSWVLLWIQHWSWKSPRAHVRICTWEGVCGCITLLQTLLTYHLQVPGRQKRATAVTTALVHLPRTVHCPLFLFQSSSSTGNYLLTAFNLLENLKTNRRPACKLRTSSVKWNKSVVWTCSLVLK